MNQQKINIAENMIYLRRLNQWTLENVAEKINVSRQAISKWEAGDTMPDLVNCLALAKLYNVTLDDFVYFDGKTQDIAIAPKGKHIFGIIMLGERGQIVIPKEARELFHFKSGDKLVVLGDESTNIPGIAIVSADPFLQETKYFLDKFYPGRKHND